jgi:hypothetical protein
VLPDVAVTDGVLMRTGSSLHRSIAAVYAQVVDDRTLLAAEHVTLVNRLHDNHVAQAGEFDRLTTRAGDTPWTCGNPKFDSSVIQPVLERITKGRTKSQTLSEVGPSDDPQRDILNFFSGLENIATSTSQAFMPLLSMSDLRRDTMAVGVACARQAAVVALTIDPTAFISETDAGLAAVSETTTAPPTTLQNIAAPTTAAAGDKGPQLTEIPKVAALPAAFGQLGPLLLVVGAGDENGVRLKVNLETPADNSYIYDDQKPSC